MPIHQTETIEKQINIQLQPPQDQLYHHQQQQHHHHHSSHTHESSIVDHCLSLNTGHKHVLIVNSYRPKSNNSNNVSPVVSNVHTINSNNNSSINSRSQSPPKMRSSCDALSTNTKTDNMSPKYAIKHKANRYVSGAIGILETSLNGEYIILENLSSNKNVNLKGWYIHRYVPDQNINLIFKFVNDTMICCGEKLKILSRSCSTKVRSTSMYESANSATANTNSGNSFKPKDKFVSDGNEKIIIASNIENWGTYSKFSVTKLINPDGVDKAVLTQSLLRLASSTSNVNVSSPRESSPNMSMSHSNKQHQHQQQSNNSSYYYNRAISNTNLNKPQASNYYEQYSPRNHQQSTSETVSTKKTTKTETSSMSHLTTMSSAPYIVDASHLPGNVHVTRQF